MTYNFLLDAYFSTYWISFGIPLVLLILWHVFRKKIRKGKEQTLGEVVAVYGIVFVLWMTAGLVNPLYWGYGAPEAVREIRYTDDKLLVIDHIRTMGSEGDEGTPCSRVHVIDPKTGDKQLRFTLGEEADLVGVHGDTLVVVKYNEAIAYSLTDGHEYVVYSKETLPSLFPELESGINNIMWGGDYSNLDYQSYSVMEITANNGKLYALYLQTGNLYPATSNWASPERKFTGRFYATEDEIKRDSEPGGDAVLELEGINGNQYEQFLAVSYDSIVNPKLPFLDPEFIAVNNPDSTCFILSYESLEHRKFILTCVSLDGQDVKWEIRQSQYNADFDFTDYWKPHTGYNETTNQLTFWIGKAVYCVDAGAGKLIWQTTL